MYKKEIEVGGWADEPVKMEKYEDEKFRKKQRIVRNEFAGTGKYGIPLIKKQDIDLDKIESWCYTKTKSNDEENEHKTVHFFTYDWLFETVYSKPEAALEKLDQYKKQQHLKVAVFHLL